MPESQSKAL